MNNIVTFQKYRKIIALMQENYYTMSPDNFYDDLHNNINRTYNYFFRKFINYAREYKINRNETYYAKIDLTFVKYDVIKERAVAKKEFIDSVFLHWDWEEGWNYDVFNINYTLISSEIVLGYKIEVYLDEEDDFLEVSNSYVLTSPFVVDNLSKKEKSILKSFDSFLNKK